MGGGGGAKVGRKEGGLRWGWHRGSHTLMTGGAAAEVSFPSLALLIFPYSSLEGGAAPSSTHPPPNLRTVCMCVYFAAKLLVLPEERKVGVLIYGLADKASVWGAVWEACNTTSFD